MAHDLIEVPAGVTVEKAIDHYVIRHDHSAFPVVDDAGRTIGLLTLRHVRRVPREQRTRLGLLALAAPGVEEDASRMERMRALDAEFLHWRGRHDAHAHRVVLGLRGAAPSLDEFAELTDAKLDTVPRYRKRARFVPLNLGRPVWADDPDFDLGNHLLRVVLHPPGADDQLRDLVGLVMFVSSTVTGRCGRTGWSTASPASNGP